MRADQNLDQRQIEILAIASASCKTVSRSGGRSSTAAAAYRTAERIVDHRTGELHDYRRRGGVDHVSMHAPKGVLAMSTETLWNRVEAAEKRKNSTVARELLIALPHELSQDQRRELAARVADRLVDRYQVAAQVAVHLPGSEGDDRNHHAHILFTTRQMGRDGELGAKTRQLDDLKTGPEEVKWMRRMVELETNSLLEQSGSTERIDMRSLAEQHAAAIRLGDQVSAAKTDRPPTVHLGPRVTAIARECAKHDNRPPLGKCTRIDQAKIAYQQRLLAQVSADIVDIEVARAARAARVAADDEGRRMAELARLERQRLDRIKADPKVVAAAKSLMIVQSNIEHAQKAKRHIRQQLQPLLDQRELYRNEAKKWRAMHPIRSFFGLDGPARQLEDSSAVVHEKAVKLDSFQNQVSSNESLYRRQVASFEWRLHEAEVAAGLELDQPSTPADLPDDPQADSAPVKGHSPRLG